MCCYLAPINVQIAMEDRLRRLGVDVEHHLDSDTLIMPVEFGARLSRAVLGQNRFSLALSWTMRLASAFWKRMFSRRRKILVSPRVNSSNFIRA